jgi:hypothetical protein
MRYFMSLLIAVLGLGSLGAAQAGPAYFESNPFNLERAEIRGYVESVQNQVAYVQTEGGDEVAVQLGPESYWNFHHYYLPEGDYVEMEVWYDPTDRYTDWYFAGEIWGPDFHVVLANNDGVPYWVIEANDYYYSLGYRASCVSYMFWYDCPPVYFVYLILPPPPPQTYVCYYGPRWQTHHSEWNRGRRYGTGGSYWRDGQGYERPGSRSHGQPTNNSESEGIGNRTMTMVDPYSPSTHSLPTKGTSQPVSTRREVTPQRVSQTPGPATGKITVTKPFVRTTVTPQKETRFQTPVSVSTTPSRVSAPLPTSPQRVLQPRSDGSVKPDGRQSVVATRVVRGIGTAQIVTPSPTRDMTPAAVNNRGQDRKQVER